MKKFKIFLILIIATFISVSSVKAETGYYNWNGTFTTNQGTHTSTFFSDSGIYFSGVVSNNDPYVYYLNFNVTNQFHSDIDTIGFYIYNNHVSYGTNSGNSIFNNSYTDPEGNTATDTEVGNITNGVNVIPPLVRVNSSTCSVKPIGVNTTSSPWNYADYFWVECDILDNKSTNVISMRWVPNANVTTSRVGIQTSFVYWSNTDTQKQIQNEIKDLNQNITSNDITDSENQANSFFEGFESDDYGLSDIITMPLDLIKGLTSNTCVALSLTIPFVNKTFQLPCMSSIYRQYFGDFFSLYQTITFGFVAYWVIVKIFALVKGFKDPNDDKVEVLEL